MNGEDFNFLSERLTEANLETAFFCLTRDPFFSRIPSPETLQREVLLLKFKQRIWEIPKGSLKDKLRPYYAMDYEEEREEPPFLLHDILYQDHCSHEVDWERAFSCVPTLSFRTLVWNQQHHIKFGLPLFYGGLIRHHTNAELLAALYLSDYLRTLPSIDKLEFFGAYKGYSLADLTDFSVAYRKRKSTEEAMPISCYFNKILNHSDGTPRERLAQTCHFLTHFLADFNAIYEDLFRAGLGLEIHGQNLLVKLDDQGQAKRAYLYRDLGNCTLEPQIQQQQTALNYYYRSNYNYTFDPNQQVSAGYYAWQNYRTFFLSFFLYNLNEFALREQLKFKAYDWFEQVTASLRNIRGIYAGGAI